ncbi:MAG: sugar transferase [Patescibacteria group bacterium]
MANFFIKTKKVILLLGDLATLYLGLYLTLIIRYGLKDIGYFWSGHVIMFTVVFVIWLLVFFINELYDLKISYNINNLLNLLVRVYVINILIAIAIFYFFNPFLGSIKPQRVLAIDVIISLVFSFLWRRIFYTFIKSSAISNKVLIIGQSPLADSLIREINHKPQLGYQAINNQNVPEDLKKYCQENQVDILVSANSLKNNDEISRKIFDCLSLGVDVYNINSFYEQITNKVPAEYLEHSWFLENLAEHSKKLYEISKRIMDVFLALLGLLVAIFIAPPIALIIKLESPGPVVFKQIRVGKNGKNFLAMKFRSMFDNAEKNGPQWASENDPRVTRFGRLMRKTRLDEIPQLINILRGEMSLVGPRPERPEFIQILAQEVPFYRERLLVKPGLTGWAQLNGPAYGGSKEESLEKVKYDLYYIKNRSLLMDLSILLKTIKVALGGRGR